MTDTQTQEKPLFSHNRGEGVGGKLLDDYLAEVAGLRELLESAAQRLREGIPDIWVDLS